MLPNAYPSLSLSPFSRLDPLPPLVSGPPGGPAALLQAHSCSPSSFLPFCPFLHTEHLGSEVSTVLCAHSDAPPSRPSYLGSLQSEPLSS